MHGRHDHHHHDHHGGHAHGHHHAHGAAVGAHTYVLALVVNLAFVGLEAAAGFFANSTALLADASHNLSDVLGLALAGVAAWLAARAPTARRSYGYGKAGVLAAIGNALALVAASGAIGWEAVQRLLEPSAVNAPVVMAVAGAGILVNAGTAMLFARAGKADVNARGAFLHLLADAAVSAAVIVGGLLVLGTGWSWVDPAVSLVVLGVVLASAVGLLREALDLALDAAPARIDVPAVRRALEDLPGVASVHDLHIWAMAADEASLTAHLVRPEGGDDAFLERACGMLNHDFGIAHVTLQIETAVRPPCESAHN